MENITQAQLEAIVKLYLAYFNRAPETSGLDYHVEKFLEDLNNGLSEDEALANRADNFYAAAVAAPAYSGYSVSMTAEAYVAKIYENVLLRPGVGGAAPTAAEIGYWVDQLNGGLSRGDMIQSFLDAVEDLKVNGTAAEQAIATQVDAVLDNRLAVALEFAKPENSGSLTGEAAFNAGKAILAGVTADPATVTAAIASLADGQTFILTENADALPGMIGSKGTTSTNGNDTIIAGENNAGGVVANTLGNADNLDGGAGRDTLAVTDSQGTTLTPRTTSVEVYHIQSIGGGTTIELINAVGYEELWNYRSTGDVTFNSVLADAAVGLYDTASNVTVNFEVEAITDATADVFVRDSDGQIQLDVAGEDVETLNVTSIGITNDDINNLIIDINNNGSALTTLNIAGDSALNLDDSLANEFDSLTTVNVTSTGALDLDLNSNDLDVDFNGGTGDTTLELGNGDSTIDTQGGDDTITVGFGDNVINTGAGADYVDVSAGGDQTVDLGDGDDTVVFGSQLTVDDSAEGGAGIDTISLNVYSADGITANGDVDEVVNGFEQLVLTEQTLAGDVNVIDLDNLDDISHVTIADGTEGGTFSGEFQYMYTNATSIYGGMTTIEGVEIELGASLTSNQVAGVIASYSADIVAAYNANHPGEVMTSVSWFGGNYVYFYYEAESGNVPAPFIADETGSVNSGATFTVNAPTDGTSEVAEQQTLVINTAPTVSGLVTLNINGTNVQANLINGQTTAQAAATIKAAIDAAGVTGVASTSIGGSTIVINYTAAAGNVAQLTYTDTAGTNATATPNTTQAYVAPVAEQQTFSVNSGTDANGGFILINGTPYELAPNLTVDQVGLAMVNILTGFANVASAGYNTLTDTVTINYTQAAGDVSTISITQPNVNFPDTTQPVTQFDGTDGDVGGEVVLNNFASGGTLVLGDANNGVITVNLDADTAADSITIQTTDAVDHNGTVDISGIEDLTVQVDAVGGYNRLDLDATGVENVTVTGVGGVYFGNTFTDLVSFDASALDADSDTYAISSSVEDVTYTGGAGQDTFYSGSGDDTIDGGAGDDTLYGGAGEDTIDGGDGDDYITGGNGADTLTGGAGEDIFNYDSVSESQGVNTDTITDFVSGEDTIDLSSVTFGIGSYAGEANGYGAVLTSLSATGDTQAVLDTSTSTLYVDVNGDGILNDQDMAINLTGVTDLSNSDFQW